MKTKGPKDIEPILRILKKELEKIYGDRLKNLILYGSYARGDCPLSLMLKRKGFPYERV
jgi:hypothetical protein